MTFRVVAVALALVVAASATGCGVDLLDPESPPTASADVEVETVDDGRWRFGLEARLSGSVASGPVTVNGLRVGGREVGPGRTLFVHESPGRPRADSVVATIPSASGEEFRMRMPVLEREGDRTLVHDASSEEILFPFGFQEADGLRETRASWELVVHGDDGDPILSLSADGPPASPVALPAALLQGGEAAPASATLVVLQRLIPDLLGYHGVVHATQRLTWELVADG